MKKPNVILVVEDSPMASMVITHTLQLKFPENTVMAADSIQAALKILKDPKLNVVAAALDNEFPVTSEPGSPIIDFPSTMTKQKEAKTEEQKATLNLQTEQGAAGVMIMRYLRTGKLGALEKRVTDIAQAHAEFSDVSPAPYKEIPVAVISDNPRGAKLEAYRVVARGEKIDPKSERIRPSPENQEKAIDHGEFSIIDNAAIGINKPTTMPETLSDHKLLEEFFSERLRGNLNAGDIFANHTQRDELQSPGQGEKKER